MHENRALVPQKEDVAAWTDAEWLKAIRPVAFYDGDEYELAEPDESYLQRWKAARSYVGNAYDPTQAAPSDLKLKAGLTTRGIYNGESRTAVGPTMSYPGSTVGVLADGGIVGNTYGIGGCTMTMVGESTAISSAHCFYNSASNHTNPGWQTGKGWAFGSIHTYANPNNYSFAYGSGVGAGCYWVTVPESFKQVDNSFNDYAVIEFSNSQAPTCNLYPGRTTGWMAFLALPEATIGSNSAVINGYPGSIPYGVANGGPYRWPTETYDWSYSSGFYIDPYRPWEITHYIDTDSGQSGAAMYEYIGGATVTVGIHRGQFVYVIPGFPYDPNRTSNVARKIDSTVVAFAVANSAL